jgi:uncharacterized integral membrane protein
MKWQHFYGMVLGALACVIVGFMIGYLVGVAR